MERDQSTVTLENHAGQSAPEEPERFSGDSEVHAITDAAGAHSEDMHQRIAFIFGAREEVERIEQYYRDHNVVEYDTPLFSTRGLFRTND